MTAQNQILTIIPFALNVGGTGANLTANNGGIVYSNASTLAILAGTSTAGLLLQSGNIGPPSWLATENNGVLITSNTGVPSISSTLPSGISATNMNLTTPTLGVASATSLNFGATATNGIIGVNGSTNAASGVVGELISVNIASGSAVSIGNGSFVNIGSFSLTPGDWDLAANVVFQPAGGAVMVQVSCWINNASATQPTAPAAGAISQIAGASLTDKAILPITRCKFGVSSTTTIYLGAYSSYTGGSVTGYGYMSARRVR